MTNFEKTAVNATTDQQGQQTEQQSNQPKKRKGMPIFWKVLVKANRDFKPQLTINNDIKRKCIERQANSFSLDKGMFWSEYMKQAGKLMDSLKYIRDCKNLGVSPMNVAEHIVFLGSTKINKVLRNGVENALDKGLDLYVDRLSPVEADEVRNRMLKAANLLRDDVIGAATE